MPIVEWCPQTLIKSLSNTCQPKVDFLHPWAVRFGSNSWANCLYKGKDTKQYKFVRIKAYKKGEGLISG